MELKALQSMEMFDVFSNSISGPIPDILHDLSKLKTFDVESNQLTGQAFTSNFQSLPSIESYRVSINSLSGTIPDLSGMNTLRELWAAQNNIEGKIDASIASLASLGAFRLVHDIHMLHWNMQ